MDFGVFWAAVAAIGTVATALVAWYQIGALKRQQQGWETLKACDRYDTDPVIDAALNKLRDHRNSGTLASNPMAVRLEITTVLNYLDGVATGIAQGLYDERIARDHLEPIMRDHVREFLSLEMTGKMEFELASYERLLQLLDSWKPKKPFYQDK